VTLQEFAKKFKHEDLLQMMPSGGAAPMAAAENDYKDTEEVEGELKLKYFRPLMINFVEAPAPAPAPRRVVKNAPPPAAGRRNVPPTAMRTQMSSSQGISKPLASSQGIPKVRNMPPPPMPPAPMEAPVSFKITLKTL
jgi:hypothetical protein